MKIKILLVEDELDLRENLRDILEINEFEVIEAEHGQEGLEKLLALSPDLIISDVMMPVMDGYEFLEKVRSIDQYANLPFIFLTAKVEKCDLRRGMETGAEDYLTKPIQAKDLLSAINIALNKKWNRDSWLQQKVQEVLLEERNIKYHELRTPLFGLMSLLQILKDSLGILSEEDLKELLDKAIISADRLNFSLLNLSRYQNIEKAEPERVWIPSVKSMITKRLVSNDKKIQHSLIGLDFGCWFDIKHFDFIVEELVSNANKFKDGDLINIELSPSKIKVSNNQMILDTPQQIVPKAFSQIRRKYFEQQGLGLGLYLASEYAKKNQGILKAKVDTDLRFCVELILPQE